MKRILPFVLCLLLSSVAFGQTSTADPELERIVAMEKELAEAKNRYRLKQEKQRLEKEIAEMERQLAGVNSELGTSAPASPPDQASVSKERPVVPPLTSLNDRPATSPKVAVTRQSGTDDPQTRNCLVRSADVSELEVSMCQLARELTDRKFFAKTNPGTSVVVTTSGHSDFLKNILLSKIDPTAANSVAAAIARVEDRRTDKQVGADSKGSGSSSLVIKGGMPRFLSFAEENGAVEGSRSGNTLTFRANPAGLFQALTQKNFFQEYLRAPALTSPFSLSSVGNEDRLTKALRNVSVGFSFDISRGVESPTLVGSKEQLSAVSVRYQFINERDPLHPRHRSAWQEFARTVGAEYHTKYVKALDTIVDATTPRLRNADMQAWLEGLNAALKRSKIDPTSAKDQTAIQEIYEILVLEVGKIPTEKVKKDPVLMAALTSFTEADLKYLEEKGNLMEERIRRGKVLSIEYTNYREISTPDLSNFRFIAGTGTASGWDVTFNSSLTFFNRMPSGANVRRIRDFDFALEFERRLHDLGFGTPVLTFAGKYQRIASDLPDATGAVRPGTRGDAAIGQLKLTFPINGTGIKLPISVSFANRTDLIKESRVRGNFGFTFDLDRLFFGKLPFLSQ